MRPIEIKSGETISQSFFNHLNEWNELAGMKNEEGYIVYGGPTNMSQSRGKVVGWKEAGSLIEEIEKTRI